MHVRPSNGRGMRSLGYRRLHKGFALLALGSLAFALAALMRDLFGWASVDLGVGACAVDVLLGALDPRVAPIALGIPASMALLAFTNNDFDARFVLLHTAGRRSLAMGECACAGAAAGLAVLGALFLTGVLSCVSGASFLNWGDAASYGAWRAGMPMSVPMPVPLLTFSISAFSALFVLLVLEVWGRWVCKRAWWSLVAIIPYSLIYAVTLGPILAVGPESFASVPWSSLTCSMLLVVGAGVLSYLFSRSSLVGNKDFYGC